jgi:hypothetical protein
MIGKAMLGRRRQGEDPDPTNPDTTPGLRIRGRHGAEALTTVLDPMDLLSTPVSDGDLTVALARRPRFKVPSLTMILMIVAVASLGFLGGILLGKHYGSSGGSGAAAFRGFAGAAAAPSAGASGTSSSSGFAGRGGTGLFGGGTFGTIKLVDGNIVYVQTAAGDIVQVSTSAATKVTISSSAPVKDLLPGETVIVQGTKNPNGSIAATSISQNSLGAGGGGAGGGAVSIGGSGSGG